MSMCKADYLKEAEKVAQKQLCYVIEAKDWKLIKDSDGVHTYQRPSTEVKGNMHKVETILDACPAKVLAAVSPTGQYRAKWDEFLAELKVEEKLSETVSLIYHGTPAMLGGLVSARDSLDVVTIDHKDGYYFVAAGTVDHPNYPPRENSVRIHQNAGYVIFPVDGEPNKTRFIVFMNTDMKMNAVASILIDQVKPRLLSEKIKNLRRGLETLDIVYQ